jgi:hypothetical protein
LSFRYAAAMAGAVTISAAITGKPASARAAAIDARDREVVLACRLVTT